MVSSRSLKLVVGPVVVLACAALAGCDRQTTAPAQPSATAPVAAPEVLGTIDRSHKGRAIPVYTVRDAGGKPLALASLKGAPVLINLWATWCAPCVAELPTLDRLAASGTVRVVTISQDVKPAGVPAFLKARGGEHLPPWLDPATELSFRYAAPTLPTSVLYDAAGKEVWRWVGGNDWAAPAAARLLAEARAGG